MTTDEPTTVRARTPREAWADLHAGNERFVRGESRHLGQDAARRAELAAAQRPSALLFGCGDSRVAAEIIFDRGLGELFVVRTAGHVVDSGVLGSIEYGVGVLGIPLVVVLGHDRCGAVAATVEAVDGGAVPGGFVRDIVERVTPSVLMARRAGLTSVDEIEKEHVRHTAALLLERSSVVSEAVAAGRCAVVGTTYTLAAGEVHPVVVHGEI